METVVSRTKRAVRRWAGLTPDAPVALGDRLDALRAGARDALLVCLNSEFDGERQFPISAGAWDTLDPKLVGDVHKECSKRIEG